jgi:uncharacterized membrane protein
MELTDLVSSSSKWQTMLQEHMKISTSSTVLLLLQPIVLPPLLLVLLLLVALEVAAVVTVRVNAALKEH